MLTRLEDMFFFFASMYSTRVHLERLVETLFSSMPLRRQRLQGSAADPPADMYNPVWLGTVWHHPAAQFTNRRAVVVDS